MTQTRPPRYRLYIDESGDHVFNRLEKPSHRYLCILGCWFEDDNYFLFHDSLTTFKKKYIPHHPDDPPILHREEIINCRGYYTCLQDQTTKMEFDEALLKIVNGAVFHIVGVVIDKYALRQKYGDSAAHPYHLALGFLLQRYCGYLNHIKCCGDVMAEGRGTREDRLLADSYARVFANGVWSTRERYFQNSLTSKELKVKKKSANISGLQLADLLVHPVRQIILQDNDLLEGEIAPFTASLSSILEEKYNRHLYQGTIEGYGKVFYPK